VRVRYARMHQTYGYDKIFTLNNLEKVGLLKKAEPRNNYPALRKVPSAPPLAHTQTHTHKDRSKHKSTSMVDQHAITIPTGAQREREDGICRWLPARPASLSLYRCTRADRGATTTTGGRRSVCLWMT
jgi:hypothetical protein